MDIGGAFKDNFKVFLPVLGLVAVIIAVYAIDLDSSSLTNITPTTPATTENQRDVDYIAEVKTSYGDFTIDLYQDLVPKNTKNFVSLAQNGFYDGLKFHRVIENFVIQTGAPGGDGYGNAGYYVDDEIVGELSFDKYMVGMASEGRPNTNSSQFFVTLPGGDFSHMDDSYTIIGEVVNGFGVVDSIGSVSVDGNNMPVEDIIVESINILEKE